MIISDSVWCLKRWETDEVTEKQPPVRKLRHGIERDYDQQVTKIDGDALNYITTGYKYNKLSSFPYSRLNTYTLKRGRKQ